MDSFFSASIDPSISEIDLHGISIVTEALDTLERELFREYNVGTKYCKVIHGIGTGELCKQVHEALEKNPMVREYRQDGGATIVLF